MSSQKRNGRKKSPPLCLHSTCPVPLTDAQKRSWWESELPFFLDQRFPCIPFLAPAPTNGNPKDKNANHWATAALYNESTIENGAHLSLVEIWRASLTSQQKHCSQSYPQCDLATAQPVREQTIGTGFLEATEVIGKLKTSKIGSQHGKVHPFNTATPF